MGNYNFYKDLDIAKDSERRVATFLQKTFNLKFVSECNNNKWDLLFAHSETGNSITVEVKEDFYCEKSGNVSVEYECRGKPSGISVSRADYYMYIVHRSGKEPCLYAVETAKLRRMIKAKLYFRTVSGGDKGSNSKNFLFKFDLISDNWVNLGVLEEE